MRLTEKKQIQYRKEWVQKTKRVIIKIGSAILACRTTGLDTSTFESLAEDIISIRQKGLDVIIVSSGAIIAGMQKLEMKERPKKMSDKQAAAAIGQTQLMWMYEKSFRKYQQKTAQILLTHDDLTNRKRFLNARHTMHNLLERGVIPIINENDTVVVEEIKFGDNDSLSSMLVNLVDSPLLIILSDVDGLFSSNPKKNKDAALVPFVHNILPFLETEGLESDRNTGTGGMKTKLEAASTASASGAATIMANGKTKGILKKIMTGEETGTFFAPKQNCLVSRKHWIAYVLKQKGTIVVDGGAVKAVSLEGRSLLPTGIVSVAGNFKAGDMVSCTGIDEKEFARGIVSFSSEEIEKIKGIQTGKFADILGYSSCDEAIHRDDLVLIEEGMQKQK